MKILNIIKAGLHLLRLLLNLGFIWFTLGWKVRKARKAFERELMKTGMPKESAKRLGKKYSSVKDEIVKQLWSSVRKR
jgi:hypothetical protein